MGKLREKRRRNRRRRLLIQLGLGFGSTTAILIAFILWINSFNPQEADADVAKETQMQETESQTETEEKEPDSMHIVMVGDMLMHEPILESAEQEDGTYNFDHLFKNVKEFISEADLAIVNQETILGGESFGYTGYPSFNTPSSIADAEAKAGFDVMLFATNHTIDKRGQGVLNCMEYMDTYLPDMDYVGINHSQEEQDNDIFVYEENSIKVAILNYTYGTNGIELPSDKPYLVNLLKEEKVRSDIRKAEEIADFTIVCPHWGTEYNLGVSSEQKKWAQIFLEEGADLVLGAHPHVIEPIEWLSDEAGNEMLVYYSVGNFINGTSSTGSGVTNRQVGGIADVTLVRNEETGEVEIREYGAVPIVCHRAEGTDYTVYFLEDYTEELAAENLILSHDSAFSKELCESIVDEVWGEE